MKPKNHWATGNSNAEKPASEKNDTHLYAACKSWDKAAWVKQAQDEGLTLAKFVIKTMNEVSKKYLNSNV